MGRTIMPVGDVIAVAAAAQTVAIPSTSLPDKGIIGFLLALSGAGNDLTDLDRIRVKVSTKVKFDLAIAHERRIVRRWSDSNLVPADADTLLSVPLNLGPAGRLDDRYQLQPGKCNFELVTAAGWGAGSYRVYVVTTDEPALGYVEAIGDSLQQALSTGPKDYTPASEGLIHGFVVNTTGLSALDLFDSEQRRRFALDVGVPNPLLEVERMEDGAAVAGIDPRAFVLKGPIAAAGAKFKVTAGAAWAGAANELTAIRHIPLA